MDMRDSMINQIKNVYYDKWTKFHYDDMRRVGIEKRNYYVRPLVGTPFSIGLTVPSNFAAYRISKNFKIETNDVDDDDDGNEPLEVDRYLKFEDTNERDLEWTVHPDW